MFPQPPHPLPLTTGPYPLLPYPIPIPCPTITYPSPSLDPKAQRLVLLYYLSILSIYCAMMTLKSRFQCSIKLILKSFLFFIHSIKQGIIQKLTYIIIPPNTAHTLKIKLDENPLGKMRFLVEWQCSVTEILSLQLIQENIHFREVIKPERYQSYCLSNNIQT